MSEDERWRPFQESDYCRKNYEPLLSELEDKCREIENYKRNRWLDASRAKTYCDFQHCTKLATEPEPQYEAARKLRDKIYRQIIQRCERKEKERASK